MCFGLLFVCLHTFVFDKRKTPVRHSLTQTVAATDAFPKTEVGLFPLMT